MTLPKQRKYRRRIIADKAPEPSAAIDKILADAKNGTLRCSFCGKSQNEVQKLIAGSEAYICNKCIDICNEIIADDQQQSLGN